MNEELKDLLEGLSYLVTVLGVPAAIFLYFRDNSKERLAEQQEIDGQLKEEYNDILDNLIEHPELDIHNQSLTGEFGRQQERIYQKLIGCFETSYIRLFDRPERDLQRMWNSWQDVIDEWLKQPNFSKMLPSLLVGEDKEFAAYMRKRSQEIKTLQHSDDNTHHYDEPTM